MQNKKISVIIPVRQISNYLISEGFPAFKKQTYKDFEVIVVCDYYNNDVGVYHGKPLHDKYSWLRIVEFSGSPSEKRNYGVKKSKGGILAFIDDDAFPNVDWINCIVGTGLTTCPTTPKAWCPGRVSDPPLRNKMIVAVCGPGILPKNVSFSEKVFDAILTSKFGSGAFTYRFQKEKSRPVDDFPLMNFAISKDIFVKFKGFVNHWPGEDSKLCEKIISAGYKIKYSPRLVVYHHRKNNLLEFLRQHSRYGFKRGVFFAEGDKNSRKLVYFLPSLFFIYLFILPIGYFAVKNFLFFFPLVIYFILLIAFFTYQIINKGNFFISILSSFMLLFLHLTYAIFFIKGILTILLKH